MVDDGECRAYLPEVVGEVEVAGDDFFIVGDAEAFGACTASPWQTQPLVEVRQVDQVFRCMLVVFLDNHGEQPFLFAGGKRWFSDFREQGEGGMERGVHHVDDVGEMAEVFPGVVAEEIERDVVFPEEGGSSDNFVPDACSTDGVGVFFVALDAELDGDVFSFVFESVDEFRCP